MYLELFAPKGLKVLSINKQYQDLLDSHRKSKKHLDRGAITVSDHTSSLTVIWEVEKRKRETRREYKRFHPASPAFGWPWRPASQTGRWKPETTGVYTGKGQKAWTWSGKLSIHVTSGLSCHAWNNQYLMWWEVQGMLKLCPCSYSLNASLLSLWVVTPYGIAYQIACILDGCITILNSNKIAVMV